MIASGVYILFELAYCMWGFPRLSAGFGGGAPRATTLWLKREDDATDITSVLSGTVVTNIGSLNRIDKLYVLAGRENDLLLTNRHRGPAKAMLISRSRLVAVSW